MLYFIIKLLNNALPKSSSSDWFRFYISAIMRNGSPFFLHHDMTYIYGRR